MSPHGRASALGLALLALVAPGRAAAWDSYVPDGCRQDEQWNAPWASEHDQMTRRALASFGTAADPYLDPQERIWDRPQVSGCGAEAAGCVAEDPNDRRHYLTDLGGWMADLQRGHGPDRERCGDHPGTGLEERFFPDPHHFAELPDALYSFSDWVTKAEFCPFDASLDEGFGALDATDLAGSSRRTCHRFRGWLGALNSSHFGTQARLTYGAFQALALELAAHAYGLRTALEQRLPGNHYYDEYVEEAERLALAVAAIAQHYLQDGWSVGHMWERWGSAEPLGYSFSQLLVTSVVAGMLHGAENVLDVPTPMCSPLINGASLPDLWVATAGWENACTHQQLTLQTLEAATYVAGTAAPAPGVGDNRYSALEVGAWNPADFQPGDQRNARCFAGDTFAIPLGTGAQRAALAACAQAGLAQVIQALGPNLGGGRGLKGIPVPPELLAVDTTSASGVCWDHWATNRAMALPFVAFGRALDRLGQLARGIYYTSWLTDNAAAGFLASFVDTVGQTRLARDFTLQEARHRVAARLAPHGTELARGELLGDFFGVRPNDRHGLASYVDNAADGGLRRRLDTIPDFVPADTATERRGRDKRRLYGLFNRAFAGYWCDRVADGPAPDPARPFDADNRVYLDGLRGTDDAAATEVCLYLAERLYRGTRDADGSEWYSQRTPAPICDLVAPGAAVAEPRELPLGYVTSPYDSSASAGGRMVPEAVIAWCRRIPVVSVVKSHYGYYPDGVTLPQPPGKVVTISGRDFGAVAGSLKLITMGATAAYDAAVVSWADTQLAFKVPPVADGIYYLEVHRPPTTGFAAERVSQRVARIDVAAADAVPGKTFRTDVGWPTACAATGAGPVMCWGWNYGAALGAGTIVNPTGWLQPEPTDRPTPQAVPGVSNAAQVAGYAMTTCALGGGAVTCWGGSEYFVSPSPNFHIPRFGLPVLGRGTGDYCNPSTWPNAGSTGDPNEFSPLPAAPVQGLGDAVWITVGSFAGAGASWGSNGSWGIHACAVTAAGKVKCWGDNWYGAVGVKWEPASCDFGSGPQWVNWKNAYVYEATEVPGLADVRQVESSGWSVCALKLDGTVWCWGGEYQGHAAGSLYAPTDPLPYDPPVRQVAGLTDAVALYPRGWVKRANGSLCWFAPQAPEQGLAPDCVAGMIEPDRSGAYFLGPDHRLWTDTGPAVEIPGGIVEVQWPCARAADGSLWCFGDGPYHLGSGVSVDPTARIIPP